MRIAIEEALPAALVVTTLLGCDQGDSEPPSLGPTVPSARPSAAPPVASVRASSEPAASAAPSGSAAPSKPTPARDFDVTSCCRALDAIAEREKDAEPPSKYTIALAVCTGIARQVKKGNSDPGSARVLVRAQLQGLAIPAGC